ncbi:MAG: hypothetical protein EBW87_06135 [Burkholderiaceae bacterium]|nr:hypothetical protein [Burkholderiaceae bacterium]
MELLVTKAIYPVVVAPSAYILAKSPATTPVNGAPAAAVKVVDPFQFPLVDVIMGLLSPAFIFEPDKELQ